MGERAGARQTVLVHYQPQNREAMSPRRLPTRRVGRPSPAGRGTRRSSSTARPPTWSRQTDGVKRPAGIASSAARAR